MTAPESSPIRSLVVCSLEAWDEVWRRNQFLVDGLLRRNTGLRVLFVEPPYDVVHSLSRGHLPSQARLRAVAGRDRLWTLRPIKPAPRRMGPWSDHTLMWQVRRAAIRLRLPDPILWVNDTTYGPLIARTGWPTVYDVTDDWLLESVPPREQSRRQLLEAVTLRDADEVVVCSPNLASSRGALRPTTLIPNGVDIGHFIHPAPRPADLPRNPVAVYVGTLHDERIDVELLIELTTRLPDLSIVFVGPDALSSRSHRLLAPHGRVLLLGPRPYAQVPAYLQHADVVIIPHRVTPFTESLDPIKAYECLAIGRPTVATDIAGFRALGPPIVSVPRERFTASVIRALQTRAAVESTELDDLSWEDRCRRFEAVLVTLRRRVDSSEGAAREPVNRDA